MTTRGEDRFDVIVVLGGPDPAMRCRMAHGLRLFAAGRADRLLLSGRGSRRRVEAEVMRDQALADGVPAERLVLEPQSRTTLENAIQCARIMRDNGWSRALVVTDLLHLPRALLAFRGLGVRAHGSVARGAWRGATLRARFGVMAYETVALAWYLCQILTGRHRRAAQALAAKSSNPSTAARS